MLGPRALIILWRVVLAGLTPVALLMAQDANQGKSDHAAFADYQHALAVADYAGAALHAREIVGIEESRHAGNDVLSAAFHRMGRAQLLAGDARGAVESLNRALELMQTHEALVSPRFVEPMADLAQAHTALGAHELAIASLQQAIAISRRANGLFSAEQFELLEKLAASFQAIGNVAGVDGARRYAVLAAEHQFGRNHQGILPAVGRLGSWFEFTGRYAMARDLYERTAEIAAQEGGGPNPAVIHALLGIGRSHRLQYVETPELVEESVWGGPPGEKFDPVTGQREAIAGAVDRPGLHATARLNRRGIEALRRGLELLNSVSDPPPDLLAITLVEIGDWYQTDRDEARAISHYKRAWPLLVALGSETFPNPLLAPRPMFYRLPPELRRNRAFQQGNVVERRVEFEMTITSGGDVTNLRRKGGDMAEGEGWQIARALNRATFSPRFENGEPVETDGFVFAETRYDVTPDDEAAMVSPTGR